MEHNGRVVGVVGLIRIRVKVEHLERGGARPRRAPFSFPHRCAAAVRRARTVRFEARYELVELLQRALVSVSVSRVNDSVRLRVHGERERRGRAPRREAEVREARLDVAGFVCVERGRALVFW